MEPQTPVTPPVPPMQSSHTDKRVGQLVLGMVAANGLCYGLVQNKDALLDFATKHIPTAVQPLAALVVGAIVLGPAVAPALAYVLNPGQLFKPKPTS